jgi:hypothetical protein
MHELRVGLRRGEPRQLVRPRLSSVLVDAAMAATCSAVFPAGSFAGLRATT